MSERTVLISGASSGIGLAIAQTLTQAGDIVYGLGRDFGHAQCKGMHAIELDLARLDTLGDSLGTLVKELPTIQALVCCAGRGEFGALEQFSYAQIRALMDLNFTSQAYLARALLPSMKRAGRGDIIFLGSEAALNGGRNGAIYSASKFALRGLAQALRDECAKSGVRVTIINPGMVKTGFFNKLDFAPGENEENFLLPEDVARAVTLILDSRPGTVFDEINLSPLKKVIQFDKPKSN